VKRRSLFATLAAMTASLALAGTMLAASPFTNGSFENGTYTDNGNPPLYIGFQTLGAGASNLTGWDIGGAGVDWISTYWNAEAGSYSLDMNSTAAGSISQTFDTVAGATYFVGFWLSGNPACGAGTKTLTVAATGGASTPYPYPVTTNLTPSDLPFQITYVDKGYTFTASGPSTTLTFTGDSSGPCGPVLDNVSVTPVASTGASCKNGGWGTNTYVDSTGNTLTFKNQGACVSHFATSGAVPIGS
jgi:choice-of-anchor C domain-containing protein